MVEPARGISFTQSSGESKRNAVAAIALVGGAVCLGLAYKELKKTDRKD